VLGQSSGEKPLQGLRAPVGFWEFALNRVEQPGRCASEGVSAVTRLGTPDLERYYRRTKAAVCPQAAGRMIGLWTAR
jgi:hypothetical protein